MPDTPPSPGFRPLLEQMGDDAPKPAPAPKQRLRDRFRREHAVGVGLALSGWLAGGALVWASQPPSREHPNVGPDPFGGDLRLVLLDADFNNLSLERRLAVMKELVAALRGFDSSGSALLASFAAGIVGEAREQLEANVQRFFADFMDSYAERYAEAAVADREEAIEDALVAMMQLGADIAGEEVSEEQAREQLQRMQRQAQREANALEEGSPTMRESAMRTAEWYGRAITAKGSVAEQARISRFSRDMVRYLRGQDVNTGKPKPPKK